ncbi:MAG: VOC family protein [Hellea sp.]
MQSKTNSKMRILGLTLALGLNAPATSFANQEQASVTACRTAISAADNGIVNKSAEGISLKFKSMRGATIKKITFISKANNQRKTIVCKVRRGHVQELVDGNGTSLLNSAKAPLTKVKVKAETMNITQYNPVIQTEDVRGTADFYTSNFGFISKYDSDWYIHLQSEKHKDVNLAILRFDHETVPKVARVPTSGLILNFEVADAKSEYSKAVSNDLPILLTLRDEPWGQRHFITADPNGVLIDIIRPIPPSAEFLKNYSPDVVPQ